MDELKQQIDFLLNRFKFERYFYLGITILSIVLLGYMIFNLVEQQEYGKILAMLAPTGLITISISRILKMWSDCIDLIKLYIEKNNN